MTDGRVRHHDTRLRIDESRDLVAANRWGSWRTVSLTRRAVEYNRLPDRRLKNNECVGRCYFSRAVYVAYAQIADLRPYRSTQRQQRVGSCHRSSPSVISGARRYQPLRWVDRVTTGPRYHGQRRTRRGRRRRGCGRAHRHRAGGRRRHGEGLESIVGRVGRIGALEVGEVVVGFADAAKAVADGIERGRSADMEVVGPR